MNDGQSLSHLPPGSELLDAAAIVQADMIELRRAIHADPEVGLELPRTQARVLESLTGLGLDISTGETCTSVVAELDSGRPGPTVLLRGDMDALPLQEDADIDFRSLNEGQMHACGHDAHTAMLAAAAKILSEQRSELTGKIRFMFQPGEEGYHGARHMIEDGVIDGVDRAFAIHVGCNAPAGLITSRRGPLLASADSFQLTVEGAGGHASMPHFAADPIPAAAAIVTGLGTMVTRDVDVNQPGLITVGHIEAGTTNNVIPNSAFIEGTIRALSEQSRSAMHEGIERVATSVASAHKCSCSVDIIAGYPVTVNDDAQADLVASVARHTVGEQMYLDMPAPFMAAEDWSYVLNRVPGAMAMLGVCPVDIEDPSTAPNNHSNLMRVNEDALTNGVALYVAMAMAS